MVMLCVHSRHGPVVCAVLEGEKRLREWRCFTFIRLATRHDLDKPRRGQLEDRLRLVIGQWTIFCSGNSSTGLGIPEIQLTISSLHNAALTYLLT